MDSLGDLGYFDAARVPVFRLAASTCSPSAAATVDQAEIENAL